MGTVAKRRIRLHSGYPSAEANRAAQRRHNLKKKYNLTSDEFTALAVSQGNACALCHRSHEETVMSDKRRTWRQSNLVVDHDHMTGAVRGLLCRSCNSGLGMLQDDTDLLARASEYVRARSRPSEVVGG